MKKGLLEGGRRDFGRDEGGDFGEMGMKGCCGWGGRAVAYGEEGEWIVDKRGK